MSAGFASRVRITRLKSIIPARFISQEPPSASDRLVAMPPAKRKVVEIALWERTDRLERELRVERAARLVQERRAARCLELLRALERENADASDANEFVIRLRVALSGF